MESAVCVDTKLIFNGEDLHDNWFYNRYYYSGSNGRFYSFQIVLNLLQQRFDSPIILETGCQRLEEDLGAGMSTSIFAEYIHRYGGKLITVDTSTSHLAMAKKCAQRWSNIDVTFENSDSVTFLASYNGPCDLLYLDSFDYPYGQLTNLYGGHANLERAMNELKKLGREKVIEKHWELIKPCQEHCLLEFKAIEDRLSKHTILLIDDNFLAGGGKPRLLKEYLLAKQWICLLDLQQSLWVRKL
jgi:hypothetical protein